MIKQNEKLILPTLILIPLDIVIKICIIVTSFFLSDLGFLIFIYGYIFIVAFISMIIEFIVWFLFKKYRADVIKEQESEIYAIPIKSSSI